MTRGRGPERRTDARVLVLAAVVALATCVVTLLLAGGRPESVPEGLPDAGAVTGWGLRVATLLARLAAVVTVGCLLVGAVLLPAGRDRAGASEDLARRAVVRAGGWAAAWAALSACVLVLTISDTVGVPLADLSPDVLPRLSSTGQARALALVVALAAVVAVSSGRGGRNLPSRRFLLLIALGALLPTAVAGHASSAIDHDVVSSGLVVHVVAATVWVGGLAGLLLHLRGAPEGMAAAVPRFSVLALLAYAALAVSGLVIAATALGSSVSAWTTGYGAIVATKIVALLALGFLGHAHRRRTIPLLAAGGSRAILRLAGIEVVLMGGAMGLAAALARTPGPPAPVQVPDHGLGHSTLPSVVHPISLAELATAWRVNVVVLLVLGLALAVYTAGVRSLVGRGLGWPVMRTVAFVAGLLLALVALCSGVATYAPAMVSVQIAQLLVALLPVPALLLLGAPLTLWLRVRRLETQRDVPAVLQSAPLRTLANPVVGATLVSALLLGVYRTPVIEVSLRSSWMHLLVLALAVVSGLVLLWSVLGVDPVPTPRSFAESACCLMAVVGCLALLAAQLRHGDRLLAGDWFRELRWGWVDPVADQRLGGAIIAAAAVGTLFLLVVAPAQRRLAGRD